LVYLGTTLGSGIRLRDAVRGLMQTSLKLIETQRASALVIYSKESASSGSAHQDVPTTSQYTPSADYGTIGPYSEQTSSGGRNPPSYPYNLFETNYSSADSALAGPISSFQLTQSTNNFGPGEQLWGASSWRIWAGAMTGHLEPQDHYSASAALLQLQGNGSTEGNGSNAPISDMGINGFGHGIGMDAADMQIPWPASTLDMALAAPTRSP
jgi:hypothetical protein